MASISTYASRFLSLASSNINTSNANDDNSDPLFKSHLDDQYHQYQDPNAASLSSSDGLPTLQQSRTHQNQHTNKSKGSNRPGSNSLAGMSRYSSYGAYGSNRSGNPNGGYSIYANRPGGSSRMMADSIREIDDDDDVDLWRNQRRFGGLDDRHDSDDEALQPSDDDDQDDDQTDSDRKERDRTSTTTSSSSMISDGANGNGGNVDPFLAEDDLQRGESSTSNSKSRKKSSKKSSRIEDQVQSEGKKRKSNPKNHSNSIAKKKGWLAHGDDSSIISEETSNSKINRRKDIQRNTLFDSTIEMDQDQQVEEGSLSAIDSGSETSREDLNSNFKIKKNYKGKNRAYDLNDDDDGEDETVSIVLSPNQSRTGRDHHRIGSKRAARTSSPTSSILTTSTSSESPIGTNKSIINLDNYNLPPVTSGDSWAPWPWYLLKLPEFIRNALDDRIWERNGDRRDEEWGDGPSSNRSRRSRNRREEITTEEEDPTMKPPGWREWNDRKAVIAFTFTITIVFVLGGAGGLGAKTTPPPTSSPPDSNTTPTSTYFSLFHSIPLLFFLTILSLSAGFAQFLLLRALRTLPARIGARVLSVALIALPVTLGLGWAWAFGGSFWDDEEVKVGGGWSTIGLISLVPLVLAIIFSRMLYSQRNSLSRSLSVLELSSRIISLHPSLIFLSFSLLASFLFLSIPVLTIFFRLFLNGHFAKLRSKENSKTGKIEWVWETDFLARLMAYFTFLVWIWLWSIGRGIMRVTISGVVAHWYYEKGGDFSSISDPDPNQKNLEEEERDDSNFSQSFLPGREEGNLYSSESGMMEEDSTSVGPSAPGAWDSPKSKSKSQPQQNPYSAMESSSISSIDLVRANFLRSTGSSLGTIIQSSFLLTLSYILLIISSIARRFARILITPGTPTFLSPLLHLATLLAGVGAIVKGVSEYGLIYTGITGEDWKKSTKVARKVTTRFGGKGALDGLIIHSLLSLSSLSLSFLTALTGFLYSSHSLHSPSDAPLIGLLCGIVPYWTLRMCGDVVGNAADTLYLCHALDLAANSPETLNEASVLGDESENPNQRGKNRQEVKSAFLDPPSGLPF